MMRFIEKYKPKKFKPVIYKFLRRSATGLVFALAWIDYLKLDGVKIFHRNDSYSSSDIDDDYDKNDEAKTALLSNLLAGFCFLLLYLFFAL
jgi:hypothetical protein